MLKDIPFSINQLSEHSLLLCTEPHDELANHILIQAAEQAIQESKIKGITEVVPSYTSLLICFDRLETEAEALKNEVQALITSQKKNTPSLNDHSKVWEIPVCYEAEFAPDMERVMDHSGLDRDEIIERHTMSAYPIYQIGFLPGFPFLGGLDPLIACPRKEQPALSIPAGSVGIGGSQTGIYSLASPGGWNIIGRTPTPIFKPDQSSPFLFSAGEQIQFYPITKTAYYQTIASR